MFGLLLSDWCFFKLLTEQYCCWADNFLIDCCAHCCANCLTRLTTLTWSADHELVQLCSAVLLVVKEVSEPLSVLSSLAVASWLVHLAAVLDLGHLGDSRAAWLTAVLLSSLLASSNITTHCYLVIIVRHLLSSMRNGKYSRCVIPLT